MLRLIKTNFKFEEFYLNLEKFYFLISSILYITEPSLKPDANFFR